MYRILFWKYQNGLSHFLGIRFQPHSMQNYLSPAVFFSSKKNLVFTWSLISSTNLCVALSPGLNMRQWSLEGKQYVKVGNNDRNNCNTDNVVL